jgi:gamma-glutamyltranspeptidase/glutathione hydrolase
MSNSWQLDEDLMTSPRPCTAAFFLSLLLICAQASAQLAPQQPESASALTQQTGHASQRFSVAAANPLATQAGYDILKAGGSALDAAIAVQMVLTLVEPQSSGIGGGAFLMHFDGQKVSAWDGRETAPAGADENLFMQNGQPLPFKQAVVGGRSVGVPGALRMLEAAHKQQGRLPWAKLFEPAIRLAEQGFAISPRLHTLLTLEAKQPIGLLNDPIARAYFFDPQGQPWPVGHVLKNPDLAEVLRSIAKEGSTALHRGELAIAMSNLVQGHSNHGSLTRHDIANYQPKQREALCFDHATASKLLRMCGFPPPSSGAIAIGQILGMLQHTPAAKLNLQDGLPVSDWLHFYSEASRLAFADRAQYVADPDFTPAPGGNWSTLLAPSYLQQRAALIGPQRMTQAPAGKPSPEKTAFAPMPEQIERGTSHISIVDAQGHAVAMTTTIEDAFGSRLMVNRDMGLSGGFLLNNQLTDFSFRPRDEQGREIANRVQPGKRPRSSMSPTLVFEKSPDGKLKLAATLGSPGGALIIHYSAKTLIGLTQWNLNAQQAISLPNFGSTGGPVLLEKDRFPAATVDALKAKGHEVREIDMTSGLQAITRTPQGWFGGADPRREGQVMGD